MPDATVDAPPSGTALTDGDAIAATATAASPTPAYDTLEAIHRRLHRLEHLRAIVGWDQAAFMPEGGNQARAEALAELAGLIHGQRTDAALSAALAAAAQESLNPEQRANLREIDRDWRSANALPADLVRRRELVVSRCEHAWRAQRQANDWAGLLPNLREVVALAREEAGHLAALTGLGRYDALLEQYEPGMTSARLDALFAPLRQALPGLIQRVVARQAERARGQPWQPPRGPFPKAAQRAVCEQVLAWLGFDFQHGRLDASTHPFAGGVPEDVRLTTRFAEDDALRGLYGAIHECGHGRYEQNRPRAWLGQPLALARSMGIHESQSLSFEMQLGRHPGFIARLAPLLRQHLGPQPAFEATALTQWVQRVEPSLIRVDADEVTYPAHVLLRCDIERALIEGQMEAEDIPARWDAGMQELLGLDTRGNHRDGAMQDIHWPAGLFGYFPSYTLGALYAAQWFAAMRRQWPGLDDAIAAGDHTALFGWLQQHIWEVASRLTTEALCLQASGEPLNPAHWLAHIERRYLSD